MTNPITKFPGYFFTQGHPDNEYKVLDALRVEHRKSAINFKYVPQESKGTPHPIHAIASQIFLKKASEVCSRILPPDVAAYYRAASYAEKEALPQKLCQLSAKQLLGHIQRIHKQVIEKNSFDPCYRRGFAAVWDTRIITPKRDKKSFTDLDMKMKEILSESEWGVWKASCRKKIWDHLFRKDPTNQIYRDEELPVLGRLAYIAPPSETVPARMVALANELHEKLQTNEDPFEIGAWFIDAYGKIHPEDDGNGRAARLWANIFLMAEGIEPFLVDCDLAYTEAVNSGSTALADYLRKSQASTLSRVSDFVNDCLRDYVDYFLKNSPQGLTR